MKNSTLWAAQRAFSEIRDRPTLSVGEKVRIRAVKPYHGQPSQWIGAKGVVVWRTSDGLFEVDMGAGEIAVFERHQLKPD